MSTQESSRTPIGAEHLPKGRSSGWDFWWRSAAGDVAVVFHGYGGGGSGEVLAEWVRRAMTEPQGHSLEARARWPIELAQELALERIQPPGTAAGTMASVAIRDDRIAVAHVGNARVYRVSGSSLHLLTRDHTLAEYVDPEWDADELERLTPTMASKLLLRTIGRTARFDIDVRVRDLAPGEAVALCTERVYSTLGDDLGDWLARGPDAPAAIVAELHKRSVDHPGAVAMFVHPTPPLHVSPPRHDTPGDPFLIIRHARDPRHEGRRYPLMSAITTIGRSEESDVIIEDDAASRRHARIERRLDGHWLIDENTNGTYIDNQPLSSPRRMTPGAQFTIGATLFAFAHTMTDIEIAEAFDSFSPTDSLTGLPNRRRFLEQATTALSRAHTEQRPLALVRFDIVTFKRLNDLYGWEAGDQVLRAIASLLQSHARNGDLIARLPGDELAWLLPDMNRDHAAQLAETLRAAVASHVFTLDDKSVGGVDLWVGVAEATDETNTAEDLLGDADPILPRMGLA